MSKVDGESSKLFKPLLVAGIILVAFGLICIFKEEGEGFRIIGIRFLIGGIVSIIIGFIAKHHMLIKYLLRQVAYKRKSKEDSGSDLYNP